MADGDSGPKITTIVISSAAQTAAAPATSQARYPVSSLSATPTSSRHRAPSFDLAKAREAKRTSHHDLPTADAPPKPEESQVEISGADAKQPQPMEKAGGENSSRPAEKAAEASQHEESTSDPQRAEKAAGARPEREATFIEDERPAIQDAASDRSARAEGKKAQEPHSGRSENVAPDASDSVAISMEAAGSESMLSSWREELAKMRTSSTKAWLFFCALYVFCSAVMYLAPVCMIVTPLMPQKVQSYVVCSTAAAVLVAKIVAQVMHPKRRMSRHALIQEQLDSLEARQSSQAESGAEPETGEKLALRRRGGAPRSSFNPTLELLKLKRITVSRKLI